MITSKLDRPAPEAYQPGTGLASIHVHNCPLQSTDFPTVDNPARSHLLRYEMDRAISAIRPMPDMFRDPQRRGLARLECWRADRHLARVLDQAPRAPHVDPAGIDRFVSAALDWTYRRLSPLSPGQGPLDPTSTFDTMSGTCLTGSILLASLLVSFVPLSTCLHLALGRLDGSPHAWLVWHDAAGKPLLLDWAQWKDPIAIDEAKSDGYICDACALIPSWL